ncbi:HAMP domain-containing sensor histidine kinase [Caballeronia sp. LZ016]|uniref:sensor histidine kinase n=1 Tax=Caballeronia sp. LZ016 TaxID=3038554 RepID=UPI00285EC4CA|nr:HAMP domain-containing sensor histidine kinase [Caballeronia sp. LZ016]MDR5740089.1 HAMP domain-containing sensor histidine kinase [Caballeronia sp. LZ016]
MTSLIDDLLDVSRVTQGLVQYQFEVLDLNRAAADAIEQVRPVIERKKHRLSLHTSPVAALVRGDHKRLVQVLANLLNDAAKYTPEGGAIEFSVGIERGHVELVVSDNGIGMTPEVTARAFELFAQAERSADRSQGGLGIGLALVRSRSQRMAGLSTRGARACGRAARSSSACPALKSPMRLPIASTMRRHVSRLCSRA